MKDIILIKLGGSVITDKAREKIPNLSVISRLAQEIGQVYKAGSALMVIGHGAGSFGHPQAKKYNTAEGNLDTNSKLGAAIVRKAVTELNSIVVAAFIKQQLPAITLSPNSFVVSNKNQVSDIFLPPLIESLNNRMIPVIHGDVVADKSTGWTILSGETILNALAIRFLGEGYNPQLIIEVGKTQGVYDENNQTIANINRSNFKSIFKTIRESEHDDVTGGMLHKVKSALDMADRGIKTQLISADPGNLSKAIRGHKVQGTLIS